jgi:P27 family predicted phage terminase small subunit
MDLLSKKGPPMGRPPKTDAQHWLGGTNVHRPIDKGANFAPGTPPAPRHLNKNARKQHNHVTDAMDERQTGTRGDFIPTEILAVTLSRWIEAKAILDAEGLMLDVEVLDSNGAAHSVRRVHPMLRVCQDSEKQCLALAAKMGLTPTDRTKAVPATGSHADEPRPGEAAFDHPELFGGLPRAEAQPMIVMPAPTEFEEEDKL